MATVAFVFSDMLVKAVGYRDMNRIAIHWQVGTKMGWQENKCLVE